MQQKPITLARRDYIQSVCDLTSKSGLPAFVVVNVLESILAQMRGEVESEIKRDEAIWRKTLLEKAAEDGAKNNVNEVDK